MAELTAEVVRDIVKGTVQTEFSDFRQEMDQRFDRARSYTDQKFDEIIVKMDQSFDHARVCTDQKFDNVIIQMDRRFAEAHEQTAAGIQSVLNTVERLNDEDRDELSGLKGRLHSHNERIAKLERLNQLR